MSEVTREEFDALAARVAAMDDRTAAQFGHIFVELHRVNGALDIHTGRFDDIDRKLVIIIERLNP